jgi:hypothetical protein
MQPNPYYPQPNIYNSQNQFNSQQKPQYDIPPSYESLGMTPVEPKPALSESAFKTLNQNH